MSAVIDLFGTWLAILFIFYVGFLAFGVNLMPGWLASRASLAVAGAAIVVGGTRLL